MSEKLPSSPRRLWIVILVLAIFLLITIGLLLSTINVRDQAVNAQMTAQAQIDVAATAQIQAQNSATESQARLLQSDTRRLGAEASNALSTGDKGELAALLSLQSLALGYNAEADLALSESLAQLNGSTIQGNQLRIFSESTPIDLAVFSPDGKLIIAHTGSVLKWWDVQTGEEVRSVPIEGNVVAFSQDHSLLLTTTADPGGSAWTAHLFETEHGTEVQHFTSQTKTMMTVHLLVGNKYVVTVGTDSVDKLYPVMQLWDAQTGREVKHFENNESDAFLSPDGKFLITTGRLGMVRLDASTLQEISKFEEDSQDFAGFSPDNRYLITGAENDTIILLVGDTGHELGRFGDSNLPAVFSLDSSLLVTTGATELHIVDLKVAQERSQIEDATGPAAFSPNGTLLAASVNDNTAHLVDTRTGAVMRVLSGDTRLITSLDFSPNGQYVLTTSEDGTARLWRADYHLTMAQVCQRLSRDLTDAERRKYDVPDGTATCPNTTDTF